MHRGWRAAVLATALGVGGVASAHEFECEKHVNGYEMAHVYDYPATLTFRYRLTNLHPSVPSTASAVADPVLAPYGWSFPYPLPMEVPVGGVVETSFQLEVSTYEDCLAMAAGDGAIDEFIDSTFRVEWPLGEDQCSARVVCEAPYIPPPPSDCEQTNTCPEPLVTRDEGFFKNHVQALQLCLDMVPADLGSVGTVSTREHALGLLWGSPALHRDGTPRAPLDARRFLLARQLLVAHCNFYLLGSSPSEQSLMEDARLALSGAQCQEMNELTRELREHNEQGRDEPLPDTFDPGPPTPGHAQSIAHDFTEPSGQSCQ